jgi:hypothetical protein
MFSLPATRIALSFFTFNHIFVRYFSKVPFYVDLHVPSEELRTTSLCFPISAAQSYAWIIPYASCWSSSFPFFLEWTIL